MTTQINVYVEPETAELLHELHRRTFATHGLSFRRWLSGEVAQMARRRSKRGVA